MSIYNGWPMSFTPQQVQGLGMGHWGMGRLYSAAQNSFQQPQFNWAASAQTGPMLRNVLGMQAATPMQFPAPSAGNQTGPIMNMLKGNAPVPSAPDMSPVGSWTQGAARMVGAAGNAMQANRAAAASKFPAAPGGGLY